MLSWLRKKFSLVNKINGLKREVIEERRLKRTWMILCADKVDEIDALQRQAKLVWNLYGIDYERVVGGLADLLNEVRREQGG